MARRQTSRSSGPAPRSVSVLVVDDEESVRRYVARILENAGYRTALASDGPEALQVAANLDALDLVVADVVMPEMNGDELAVSLRLSRPELKVLYLTGFSDTLFKARVVLRDGEAYLDKPCSSQSLVEAVSLLMFGRADTPATLKGDPDLAS